MSRMSKDIVFNNPLTAGYILIDEVVIERISTYRQRNKNSSEAGGLLLGYRRGSHLEIIDITEPYSKDIRQRCFFYRYDSEHERYAKKQWKDSKKTVDYLGEWHTHPESKPSPSKMDKSEWERITAGRSSTLAFLICGIDDIWLGTANETNFISCTLAT